RAAGVRGGGLSGERSGCGGGSPGPRVEPGDDEGQSSTSLSVVMAGLDPAIQRSVSRARKVFLDPRVKPGGDEGRERARDFSLRRGRRRGSSGRARGRRRERARPSFSVVMAGLDPAIQRSVPRARRVLEGERGQITVRLGGSTSGWVPAFAGTATVRWAALSTYPQ